MHTPTAPVAVGADGSLPAELPELIATMYETMDAAHGVGLAANQIGYALRLFVYDCADDRGDTQRRRGVIINPVLETSEVPETMPDAGDDDEGRLSVPASRSPPAGQVGAGHRSGRRWQSDRHRGHRPVRPDAATRNRSPRRVSLSGPADRPACPRRQACRQVARLGSTRAVVETGRRTRPVRPLMVSWPDLGTRVTVRYRRRAGSMPPLTDAVGHLLAVNPVVRVQTKTGAVVECAPADVVAVRTLTRRAGAHRRDPGTRACGRGGLARRPTSLAGRLADAR